MAKRIVTQPIVDDKNEQGTPPLWTLWWNAIVLLRPAFARTQSFLWFVTMVAGLSVSTDTFGVMSIVRALHLDVRFYDMLIKHFRGNGVRADALAALWVKISMTQLFSRPVRVGGRRVLVGDGIKAPKCGRKMPAVRLVHQESETKPTWAMAHSLQAVSALVHAGDGIVAVPLIMRIHQGIVWCNANKQTLLTKMLALLDIVAADDPYVFIGDAYYAARTIILGMLSRGNHVVTRVRNNVVANVPYVHHGPRKRGRPRIYGKKIALASLLKNRKALLSAPSPLCSDASVTLCYTVRDLLWKPIGKIVRFVAVVHPSKGSWLILCSDTSMEPLEIIRLYGLRFRIELSFKHAVHTIGTFSYRFWMRAMTPLRYGDGDQYLHRKPREYREAVAGKLATYHLFIQAGIIAQGLLQYLAATFPEAVWSAFGSRLRTIRRGVPPSEFVVAEALRHKLPEFLTGVGDHHPFAKFITERQDFDRAEVFRVAA
jgi:hypothetical protein